MVELWMNWKGFGRTQPKLLSRHLLGGTENPQKKKMKQAKDPEYRSYYTSLHYTHRLANRKTMIFENFAPLFSENSETLSIKYSKENEFKCESLHNAYDYCSLVFRHVPLIQCCLLSEKN
jgi:hypothetical protein